MRPRVGPLCAGWAGSSGAGCHARGCGARAAWRGRRSVAEASGYARSRYWPLSGGNCAVFGRTAALGPAPGGPMQSPPKAGPLAPLPLSRHCVCRPRASGASEAPPGRARGPGRPAGGMGAWLWGSGGAAAWAGLQPDAAGGQDRTGRRRHGVPPYRRRSPPPMPPLSQWPSPRTIPRPTRARRLTRTASNGRSARGLPPSRGERARAEGPSDRGWPAAIGVSQRSSAGRSLACEGSCVGSGTELEGGRPAAATDGCRSCCRRQQGRGPPLSMSPGAASDWTFPAPCSPSLPFLPLPTAWIPSFSGTRCAGERRHTAGERSAHPAGEGRE